jgi:hypothetical protein
MSNSAHYDGLARACETAAANARDRQVEEDCLEMARRWRLLSVNVNERDRRDRHVPPEIRSWLNT